MTILWIIIGCLAILLLCAVGLLISAYNKTTIEDAECKKRPTANRKCRFDYK